MIGKAIRSSLCVLSATLLWSGCNKESSSDTQAGDTNRQVFEVKGVVKDLSTNGRVATIAHEEITNYMAAMTMDFEVKDKRELKGLRPGDAVVFRMVVTKDDGWIENVRKLPPAAPANAGQVISINATNETNALTFR